MMENYIPILVHDLPCCGMVVTLDTKDDGKEARLVPRCPLHGEVEPEACRIWRQEDENRGR